MRLSFCYIILLSLYVMSSMAAEDPKKTLKIEEKEVQLAAELAQKTIDTHKATAEALEYRIQAQKAELKKLEDEIAARNRHIEEKLKPFDPKMPEFTEVGDEIVWDEKEAEATYGKADGDWGANGGSSSYVEKTRVLLNRTRDDVTDQCEPAWACFCCRCQKPDENRKEMSDDGWWVFAASWKRCEEKNLCQEAGKIIERRKVPKDVAGKFIGKDAGCKDNEKLLEASPTDADPAR